MNNLENLLKEVVQLEALKREAEIKLWKEIKKLVKKYEGKKCSGNIRKK
jgi:hypothetical protein